MRLTEAQLRQILRASARHPEHGTGGRSAQVTQNTAVDTSAEPKQKIPEVKCAAETVSRAADDVIGATQTMVPGSLAAEMSPSLKDAQGGLIEQSKFPLPVPTSGAKRISRRPSVRLTIALSVLLVSAVVAASVLLVGGQSEPANVEAREPPISVALSEPVVATVAADRPSLPADAPDRTPAPSTQPHAVPASIQDVRPAVPEANRDPTVPAGAASRAMTVGPARTALARPTAPRQPARGGGSMAGNAGIAGNTVTPQAQTQRAGTGSARVATLGPKTGGASGSRAQPSSPHPDATAAGIAVGASALGSSEGLAACLAARPAALRLPQDETAKLFKRGEEYMGQGRISAGRLLFQRAAEACDRKSAFALGASYDPLMLKKFGSARLDPNVATARVWYEQARRLGLSEAAHQLELLSTLPQ